MQQAWVPQVVPDWAEPVLEQLLTAYSRHFDIHRNYRLLDVNVPVLASFHSRGEKYVLVKKAQLWAIECNEHILFAAYDHFTLESLHALTALLEAAEGELVKPHDEHMYTHLSAVVLAKRADPEALRALRRYRFRKSYRLSLRGWCYGRLALYHPDSGEIAANADGKELYQTIARTLQPQKQASSRRFRR